ncbi:MAG: carboxylating nicotinate-nucleotide diphosphorylase [Leptospiraceae bacterium]|nr:carboxylating nicotinate-nucleotide diphosphorylase [Leptospiraceae bacterium]MCP5493143.1 carboxylating nicotinate-nucleotide diphosphorylase [Leptospiraceae bacterium]
MKRFLTQPIDNLSSSDYAFLVKFALQEDCPEKDITSEAIFSSDQICKADLIFREEGILCGTGVLDELRQQTNNQFTIQLLKSDGDKISSSETIAILSGNLNIILRIERVLLNFIQYLSGIATETNRIVRKYPNIMILDTRKTLPGYRKLVKYAVYSGGGANHRINLSDMALIKDNHVAMSGSILQAVQKIKDNFPGKKIELEVDEFDQLEEAIRAKPDIIMLDNFSIENTKKAIDFIRQNQADITIECSGGITPEKLDKLSNMNVDNLGVSMGYLTHTTRFLDLTLDIKKQ